MRMCVGGRVVGGCIVIVGCLCASAADITSRKMAWAHYVGWTIPEYVSLESRKSYVFPIHERGDNPFSDEIKRAMDAGLDGFFVDVIIERRKIERCPAFHTTVESLLDAAKGTGFCVAPCLDVKTSVTNQIEKICWLVRRYGNHPNYPRMGNRYVIATFTHHQWTPDEWLAIRTGCEQRGCPLFIVGNVKAGCGLLEPSRLARYKDSFDVCYSFAYAGRERLPEAKENRANADWCKANGKMFMPCIHPGYQGAWLQDHNPSYHPYQGADKFLRGLFSAVETGDNWLHFTSWNDIYETALEQRTLTPGDSALMREAVAAFKGVGARSEKADVLFAYHREELPGTLLRIEAVRLPSVETNSVEVSGRLRDAKGNVLVDLPVKTLENGWDRTEWLVPSASLASTPHIVPEFAMRTSARNVHASFPALFLRTPWIENQVTVKATFADRMPRVAATLFVSWADGQTSTALSFTNSVPVKRAILFKNDRPVGQYGWGFCDRGRAMIPLFIEGRAKYNVSVSSAILRGETLREMDSLSYRAVTLEGDARSELKLVFAGGVVHSFALPELAKKCRVSLPDVGTTIRAFPDCTLRDMPSLDAASGTFHLNLFDKPPSATDSYFVRFELPDGRTVESDVIYPFISDRLVALPVLETSVTLETLPGEEGLPRQIPIVAHTEFLTPSDERPVHGTTVVDSRVAAASLRSECWPLRTDGLAAFSERHIKVSSERFKAGPEGRSGLLFQGNDAVRLPVRMWPIDTAKIEMDIAPNMPDGKDRTIIGRKGDGLSVTLVYKADGRIEARWSGLAKGGIWKLEPTTSFLVVSRDPLPVGKWTRICLSNDHRKFSLSFDGRLQSEVTITAFRDYGPCTMFLGGVAGADLGFRGKLANFRIGACVDTDQQENVQLGN